MASPTVQIDALLKQIQTLGSSLSVEDRAKVSQSVLSTLSEIETPYEHFMRLSRSHLVLAAARLGVDIGLFRTLTQAAEPLSNHVLAEKCDISAGLLGRLLRLLASAGLVTQPGKNAFHKSRLTEALAGAALESGVHLLFDIHNRTFQALPDFLKDHKYREVDDIRNGVFQKAFGTDLSCYEYLVHHPKLQGYMQDAMKLQPPGGDWLSVFPINEEMSAADTEPLFVDIGGGMGHQCIRFRERYPNVSGRVILQDMPITISRVPNPMPHGIEAMPHNIDDAQPIKGAKFYYTRNVLHGLPDDHSILVLKQTKEAMSAGSRLIIDDIVVPDQGACQGACQLDFIMLASIAGKKRTRAEWYQLLEAAGFKILDIRPYDFPLQDSLIIAE